jgi:hypothetical protein
MQGGKVENSTVREKSGLDLFSALVNLAAMEDSDSFRWRKKSHLLGSWRKKSAEAAQAQTHLGARRQGGEQHCSRETVVHMSKSTQRIQTKVPEFQEQSARVPRLHGKAREQPNSSSSSKRNTF